MNSPTAYHQLGCFVVNFQHLESSVNDLLELLSDSIDCEVVRILTNDLEYRKRLNAADVLFARFVDLRNNTDASAKGEFHKLIVELGNLGERRNELVHSRYYAWFNVEGNEGILRQNSTLRGSKGEREEKEEELQPGAFDQDLRRLFAAASHLEEFRLRIIDWLYPE